MGQALTGPSPTHRLLSSPESRLSLVSGHGFSIEKKRREKKTVRLQLNNSSLGSMAASGEQRGAFSDRPSRSIFGIRHRALLPKEIQDGTDRFMRKKASISVSISC